MESKSGMTDFREKEKPPAMDDEWLKAGFVLVVEIFLLTQ